MENRWERVGSAIVWEVAKKSIPHTDHLEMSGKKGITVRGIRGDSGGKALLLPGKWYFPCFE